MRASYTQAHCEPIANVHEGVMLTAIGSGDTLMLLGGSAYHPVLTEGFMFS